MRHSVIEKICKRALKKWGARSQLDMAVEECSELIKAIMKFNRNQEAIKNGHNPSMDAYYEVCYEIADVEIMMVQLRQIFDSMAIDKQKEYQLTRLFKMVHNE
jgi:hypothetical protein